MIILNYLVILSHRCSITVSLPPSLIRSYVITFILLTQSGKKWLDRKKGIFHNFNKISLGHVYAVVFNSFTFLQVQFSAQEDLILMKIARRVIDSEITLTVFMASKLCFMRHIIVSFLNGNFPRDWY